MVVTRSYLDISVDLFILFILFIYLFIYLLNIYTGRIFLTSSFSHLLMTQKPDVRVKIIPLAFSLFTGSSVKHLQRPIPYHEINVFSRPHFFTIELYTSHLHSQFVFLFHNLCTVILTRIIDYYCYFQVTEVLIQGLFITSTHQIMTNGILLKQGNIFYLPQYQQFVAEN